MRGIEAAGANEAEGHADAGANESGEGVPVGADGVAAFALGYGVLGWVVEVIDEVAVVGDEIDAVFGCGGGGELLDEIFVAGEGIWALDIG